MPARIIDFFDRSFASTYHDIVDDSALNIDNDYLSAGNTTIEITKNKSVSKGQWITIAGHDEFLGVVTEVDDQDYTTKVTFKPWLFVFDHDVRLQTTLQNKTALETVIKNLITEYWIGSDAVQKLPISEITTTSSTKWTMDIEPDNDKVSYAIIAFHSKLIQKAMTKYGVGIHFTINKKSKSISISIGKSSKSYTIDCDLPNVKVNTFTIDQRSDEVNKLEIWNSENFTSKITYYLHPDGSYNTTNSDRIKPVNIKVVSASAEYEGSDEDKKITKTFADAAKEKADDIFSTENNKTNVDISILPTDTLVKYKNLVMGQYVNLIKDGVQYSAMYTGVKYGPTEVNLLFGMVRSSYTKTIRLEKAGIYS